MMILSTVILIIIYGISPFIRPSRVVPKEILRKTEKLRTEAEVVGLQNCFLGGCIGRRKIWPSPEKISIKLESNSKDSVDEGDSESYYHIFNTPKQSISSFQTIGMTHAIEGNLWESPESPFKRFCDDDNSSVSEEEKIVRVIRSHPLLKEIQVQMQKLELIQLPEIETTSKSNVKSVLETPKLLQLICSFVSDDFNEFRLVSRNFRDAKDEAALQRLKNEKILKGVEANLCLTQIMPNRDGLVSFLKEGLLGAKDKPVLGTKFLILTEIALKMNFILFEDLSEFLSNKILVREIFMLGLEELFMLLRQVNNKFYLETLKGTDESEAQEAQSGLILLVKFDRRNLLKIALDDLQAKKDEKLIKMVLIAAVQFNRPEMIQLIASKTFDFDSVSVEIDRNPLMLAIELGHLECLKTLFSLQNAQKKINFYKRTNRGMTIAHFAVHGGNEEIIEFLWKEGVFLANPIDNYDRTALHFAAAFAPKRILALLLSLQSSHGPGYPLMTCDLQGSLPLHYAISAGNYENAEFLLKEVDHSIYYPSLFSVLSQRQPANNEAVLPLDLYKQGPSSPQVYKRLRFFRRLNQLRNEPENILPDSNGAADTPLHFAVKYDRPGMVELLLLNDGLPQLIGWRDAMGRTAFLLAIIQGNSAIVAQFLQRISMDSNQRLLLQIPDFHGNNGLHFSIKFDHEDIFDMLFLAHLYNIHDPDAKGFTPLQLAQFYGRSSIIRKIKKSLRT